MSLVLCPIHICERSDAVRYTWSDCYAVVQHEYSRVISFLKLEEHRNRKLEPLPENDTSESYYRSLDQALHAVL